MSRFKRMNFTVFTLVLALLVGSFALPAQAQSFLKDYAKPLPGIELLPEAEFKAQTTVYEDKPFDDAALEYQLRLPEDWTMREKATSSDFLDSRKVFNRLAVFYGPPAAEARSVLSIESIRMEYRLTAEQWMYQYLLKRGLAVQGFSAHDKKRAEAMYVIFSKDVQYVVRILAVLNGQQVVLVKYSMPTSHWKAERALQAQVLNDFHLKNDIYANIEDTKSYRFLDIAKFDYPASWDLKAPPLKSIDSMGVEIFNINKAATNRWKRYLNGKMEVDLVSGYLTDDLLVEVEKIKTGISEDLDLKIGELIDYRDDFEVGDIFRFQALDVYKVEDNAEKLIRYEMWFATLASDDYFYLVSLITPAREQDYFIWARNTNTFMDMLKSFSPVADGPKTQK